MDRRKDDGLVRAVEILPAIVDDIVISKHKLKQAEGIEMIRMNREQGHQTLGFSSRPFVLCGLPVRRPPKDVLLHERRNGQFLLEVTGHPKYGLPYGQDRLVPIFLATLAVRQQSQTIRFESAAEMLDTFGLAHGGKEYRRLIGAFERIFGATIFFGSDTQTSKARVIERERFTFLKRARLWYSRNAEDQFLPGEFQNLVVLSPEFYDEVTAHPVPADLQTVKTFASFPALLDLFMWLAYRCFVADSREYVPLFGSYGLVNQLGTTAYTRPRRFRQRLESWLDIIRAAWPECPAAISADGQYLSVAPARAILSQAAD
jgi:Plasmid encoded RepA protein